MDDALKREIIDKTALKRHGTPQDIARTALFLAKRCAVHHRANHRRRRRPQHLNALRATFNGVEGDPDFEAGPQRPR